MLLTVAEIIKLLEGDPVMGGKWLDFGYGREACLQDNDGELTMTGQRLVDALRDSERHGDN